MDKASEIKQIMSEHIQIHPFEIVQLLSFSIVQELNEHASLSFRAVIAEENHHKYLTGIHSYAEITATKRQEDGQETEIFTGLLQSVRVDNEKGVYYLEASAVSATILLDMKQKKRSFQNLNMTYEELYSQVISNYTSAAFIDTASKGKQTGRLLLQYKETDWAFIKRIASLLGTYLISSDRYNVPRFYLGFPDTEPKGEVKAYNYMLVKDMEFYRRFNENSDENVAERDCISYDVETLQFFSLGDKVIYQGSEWQIAETKRSLEGGVLVHNYRLIYPEGGIRLPYYNERIKGISLKGIVQQVEADKIKVVLDIDQDYGGFCEYWFTYSTGYTSDNNIGWYMMPEPGDRVRIYFPDEEEDSCYATGSIREDQGQADYLNPDIKTLKNKYGKTITLEPDKITIFADGVQISLSDLDGIVIKSDQGVSLNGSKRIQVHGNEILMDAAEQIKLSVNSNSITVNERILLNGTDIKMN